MLWISVDKNKYINIQSQPFWLSADVSLHLKGAWRTRMEEVGVLKKERWNHMSIFWLSSSCQCPFTSNTDPHNIKSIFSHSFPFISSAAVFRTSCGVGLCLAFMKLSSLFVNLFLSLHFSPNPHWAEHEWQGSKCFQAMGESLLS